MFLKSVGLDVIPLNKRDELTLSVPVNTAESSTVYARDNQKIKKYRQFNGVALILTYKLRLNLNMPP